MFVKLLTVLEYDKERRGSISFTCAHCWPQPHMSKVAPEDVAHFASILETENVSPDRGIEPVVVTVDRGKSFVC